MFRNDLFLDIESSKLVNYLTHNNYVEVAPLPLWSTLLFFGGFH